MLCSTVGESVWECGCEQGGVSVEGGCEQGGVSVGVNKGESVWEGGCEQEGVSVGRWA